MKRRTAALVLGVLALGLVLVLALGVAVLATYPVSYDTPHGAGPDAERFTVDLDDAFHLNGTVTTDGEQFIRYEAVRTAAGEHYEYVDTEAGVTEVYQAEPGGELYRLYRYTDDEDVRSVRARTDRNESRTLVSEERVDGEIRLLVVDQEPRAFDGTIENAEVMLHNGLQGFTAFERIDAGGASHVYEPQAGWYSHSERTGEYRVTEAAGQIRVDPETDGVVSAAVRVEYTSASTYLEDLRGEGTTETVETTIDVDDPPATIEEPEWVEAIRAQR